MIRSRVSVDVAGLLQESRRHSNVAVPIFSVISIQRQRFRIRRALPCLAAVDTIGCFNSAGDRRQRLACPARGVPVDLYL